MTDNQQSLKAILDKWTACTITIEEAERDISRCFSPGKGDGTVAYACDEGEVYVRTALGVASRTDVLIPGRVMADFDESGERIGVEVLSAVDVVPKVFGVRPNARNSMRGRFGVLSIFATIRTVNRRKEG